MKTPFPSGKFHTAVVDKSQIRDLQNILQLDLNFWLKELDKATVQDIYGVFAFKCVASLSPQRPISAWLLSFFGTREFFGITYPRSLCGEIILFDADPDEITHTVF